MISIQLLLGLLLVVAATSAPTEDKCTCIMDFGVLIDGTQSEGLKNFELTVEFVADLASRYDVNKDDVHFGIIQFGNASYVEFRMDDSEFWDPSALNTRINSIVYLDDNITRTDIALRAAETELFCDSCGVRKSSHRYLIAITDGKTNYRSDPLDVSSQNLKEKQDVTIISVGVGNQMEPDQLLAMATDEDHVFMLDDYEELFDIVDEIVEMTCSVDGQWSEWSEWSGCSASCNGGERQRQRKCDGPKPCGGEPCQGPSSEIGECNTDPCPSICKERLEIGLMLDGTQSVGAKNYQQMKLFSYELTKAYEVSEELVHFGLIYYGNYSYLDFKFSDEEFWDPDVLRTEIQMNEYVDESVTRTDIAMRMAETDLYCDSCGVRADANRFLIVLTDGNCNYRCESMTDATKVLKEEENVKIIAVGVGDEAHLELDYLEEMSSGEGYYIRFPDFSHMLDEMVGIVNLTCPSITVPTASPQTL